MDHYNNGYYNGIILYILYNGTIIVNKTIIIIIIGVDGANSINIVDFNFINITRSVRIAKWNILKSTV